MPKKPISLPKGTKIPDHIAVILDGNGRWARSRGLPVTKGHEEGAKAVSRVLKTARELGVHTLTLWGFSTENWGRPTLEVRKILGLVEHTIKKELDSAKKENVRLIHLGRKDRLPGSLLKMLAKAEEETKDNTKYVLNLAIDYGGRDEMLRAVKQLVLDEVDADDIDEKLFSNYLDTADQPYPNPDLFIRTSGELRTSGLLPWQMSYTELYFEEDHLPDMTPEKMRGAILDYSHRRRRFGAKDKVTHFKFKPGVAASLELNWWRLAKIPDDKGFRRYTVEHIQEQWGLSKRHATDAAKFFIEASVLGRKNKWGEAGKSMRGFYEVIREEVRLAFEPKVAANLQVKLWQEMGKPEGEVERAARAQLSEVYRISKFQAGKAAHLKALATRERKLAESENSEAHWARAEDYLQLYYKALKERVA